MDDNHKLQEVADPAPENATNATTDEASPQVEEPKTPPKAVVRPKPFNYDSAMPIDEWEKWVGSFKSYLWATRQNLLSDEVKISALLDELGPKGRELLETFKTASKTEASQEQDVAHPDQPADPSDQNGIKSEPKVLDLTNFEDVMSAFTAHFVSISSRNLVYERFKFNTFNWMYAQPLREYIKVLKRAAVRCDFLEMDNMIRDRLLLQVRDIKLLESLLKIKDLTLEKTIEMCQEHEEKDYRHNPNAQRPPPESESGAKRRRKRKRKAAESAGAEGQSNDEAHKDSGSEANNKSQDTTKLRPSKKKRHRWAKALQNVKLAMQT